MRRSTSGPTCRSNVWIGPAEKEAQPKQAHVMKGTHPVSSTADHWGGDRRDAPLLPAGSSWRRCDPAVEGQRSPLLTVWSGLNVLVIRIRINKQISVFQSRGSTFVFNVCQFAIFVSFSRVFLSSLSIYLSVCRVFSQRWRIKHLKGFCLESENVFHFIYPFITRCPEFHTQEFSACVYVCGFSKYNRTNTV